MKDRLDFKWGGKAASLLAVEPQDNQKLAEAAQGIMPVVLKTREQLEQHWGPATKPLGPNPDAKVGIGGAPTRVTTLPDSPAERKKYPIASGVLDYFPDAIAAIAHLSWVGNEQHNPGQPLHWARGKSQDEADTLMRHFVARGTIDKDRIRHTTKVAWRALAMLQKELEEAQREEEAA